jgi:GalNAc-alpha-(1->4)-GalNAc-alpha-(1->3)-diNAcBac-PP-undecaprenol alpha-1,4-N-acetyl-D-galactosaminyltransferase
VRITFVTPSLACGGAERCVTLLTRGLLANGHSVSVLTLYSEDSDFYILPKGAERIALGIDGNSATVIHGLANNLHRLRVLRRAIKSSRPEVVISHIHRTNVMTILALGRTAIPVIAVEHNDPGMNPAGRIWENLRRRTYPRVRKLVSVSRGVDEQFSWLAAEQRTVIHNPLELLEDGQASDGPGKDTIPRQKWIAAMGRLTPQKGFDLLLQAFAKVAAQHPDWGLMIIGEGELRSELEELSAHLGLSQRVLFAGLLANPLPALRNSQLFAMASRFEGLPYAALEAMACGLPVIYTDCPSGPREIIREGVDGLLVPNGDVAALAAAMDRLMSDNAERARLAARAPEVLERFGADKIVAQWEDLFAAVM